MADHGREHLRPQCIAQAGYGKEEDVENNIQDEEDGGNNAEPVAIVRYLVQQDGDYTRAHGDDEPSGVLD